MLNPNINYPYPVIRASEEDYHSTTFKGDLVVNLQPDSYLVHPAFEINNAGIAALIEEGKLMYAVEIQSPATWYRKLFRETLLSALSLLLCMSVLNSHLALSQQLKYPDSPMMILKKNIRV